MEQFNNFESINKSPEEDRITIQGPKDGRGGGLSLEPWSPEMFVVEPGAQSLSRLEARIKILFLAKWSLGVKQWSPRTPNFPY